MSNTQPRGELTRFGAYYSAGLTVEADPKSDPPRLSIDGQKIKVVKRSDDAFVYSEAGHNFVSKKLRNLTKLIINDLWDREGRVRIKDEHVKRLKDRDGWNKWRRDNPSIRPLLFNAPLRGEDLSEFNFCNANLIEADLRGAKLVRANFHEANLGGAHLNKADLSDANFCRTDLYETDFSGANLTGANLQGTQMARTNFSGATVVDCTIYGMSAWNLKVKGISQSNLKIRYRVQLPDKKWDEGDFHVGDIEVAQLVFLLLDNTRINNLFDQLTSKAVVILSRFEGKERQEVIAKLRSRLRGLGYLPIVFDFARPPARDLTETIKTLVGLCNFAIVDLTDPISVPLELYATITDYQVPFVPIIQAGQKPFSVFEDFKKFSWLLPTLTYESADSFTEARVKRCIIDKASDKWKQILKLKKRKKSKPKPIERW